MASPRTRPFLRFAEWLEPRPLRTIVLTVVIVNAIILGPTLVLLQAANRDLNHHVAQGACRNAATLARIQRATVEQQNRNTAALLKGGVTFGIPPSQLHRLVIAQQRQQDVFLAALDALAKANCT